MTSTEQNDPRLPINVNRELEVPQLKTAVCPDSSLPRQYVYVNLYQKMKGRKAPALAMGLTE